MKAISIYALTRNQNMECVQKLERQLSSRDFFLRIKAVSYTHLPSKPISITLRQDTLPGKGNSISEDIPYFEPTQTTPAIYRSFTDFAGSDSSRWICTYKHSKTGKWYIWDQSWHDLLTRIKQPAGNYEY